MHNSHDIYLSRPLTTQLVRVVYFSGLPVTLPCAPVATYCLTVSSLQNHLWQLFARHTTMTLIILYLVYTQVSTVVSDECLSCVLSKYVLVAALLTVPLLL